MKFKLLNKYLFPHYYDDKEVDKICSILKGTVYENRISIVPQFVEWLKEIERNIFVDINSLEELSELYAIFDKKIILDFEEEPCIIIYDNWIE